MRKLIDFATGWVHSQYATDTPYRIGIIQSGAGATITTVADWDGNLPLIEEIDHFKEKSLSAPGGADFSIGTRTFKVSLRHIDPSKDVDHTDQVRPWLTLRDDDTGGYVPNPRLPWSISLDKGGSFAPCRFIEVASRHFIQNSAFTFHLSLSASNASVPNILY